MPAFYSSLEATKPLPLDMTDTLRKALARIASNKYRRGRNEWHTPSAPAIKPDTVARLKCRNMVEIRKGEGADRLVVTEIGRAVADMVAASRARRAG